MRSFIIPMVAFTQGKPSENDSSLDDDQLKGSRFGFFQYCVVQGDTVQEMRGWVLLDNESTVHAFCNASLTKGVFSDDDDPMTLFTNSGTLTTTRQCKIENLDQTV